MDRRQQKTRRAIMKAFRTLLEKKRYDHITVQEIIDAADVGRSTFYAHFETKDLLLDAMCEEIFNHVFENDPCPWVGFDGDLRGKLAHILWHIRDSKNDLTGILLSDSGELFMNYFKARLWVVFDGYYEDFGGAIPREFHINHLTGSFAEAVLWWLRQGTRIDPEETAGYFMYCCGLEESNKP